MMKQIVILLITLLIFFACSNSKTPKVKPYYFAKSWDRQFLRIPLYEPLAILKNYRYSSSWSMSFDDFLSSKRKSVKYNIGSIVDSMYFVGVEKGVVYGILDKQYITMNDSIFGDYAFMDKIGTMYFPLEKGIPSENQIQIELVDSVKRIFLIPKRWYIVNTNDTSFNYIFKETDYKKTLKDLCITETLYNIDEIYDQFNSTGILPWFPDNVKVLLK